jgi:WD40 repeat protein
MDVLAKMKYHIPLANYFVGKPLYLDEPTRKKPNTRKLVEQPWQQTKGEMWDEVTNTLCNLDFIQAKAVAKMTYELVSDFNAALEVIPDNAENIRKEKARQARMDKYTRDLIACAEGKISRFELKVPDSITPWTKDQTEAEIERIKTNPTRADILKEFSNFIGHENIILQNYANEIEHLAIQQAWNYANDGPVGKAAGNYSAEIYKFMFLRCHLTRPSWNPLKLIIRVIDGNSPIAMTSNGQKAIIGGKVKNTCILLNLKTGQIVHVLYGHTKQINKVSITPDGKFAITGSDDNTSIFWDLETGQPIHVLCGHSKRVNDVSILPNGKFALSGSDDKTCIFWDLETGRPIQTLKGHSSEVNAVAITPDSKIAITGSNDRTCILWDVKTGQSIEILQKHLAEVQSISLTPDGIQSLSCSSDNIGILWNLQTGKSYEVYRGGDRLSDFHGKVAFRITGNLSIISPDGCFAFFLKRENKLTSVIFKDKDLTMLNLKFQQDIQILQGHTGNVDDIAIAPDCDNAISSSSEIIMWNLKNGYNLNNQDEHKDSITSIAILPNGENAVSSSKDGTIALWDLNAGKIIRKINLHVGYANSVACTPDGNRLFIGGSMECYIWNLYSNKVQTLNEGHSNPFIIWAVAVTPDGKFAISVSADRTGILWNLKTGQKIIDLKRHYSDVETVAISPDGKYAITGSNDKTCIIWNLKTHRIERIFKKHQARVNSVSINPNGKFAISKSIDDNCILWNIRNGLQIKTFKEVKTVFVSPDGNHAISGFQDKTCILWNLNNGKQLAKFILKSPLTSAQYFPNGIIVGCGSGEILILNLDRNLLNQDIRIVTIRYIWDFELHLNQPLSADCPLCGYRFAPPASVLATIKEITNKAGLRPEQSPCLELPKEVWEEPGLLGNCPNCREALKFNPFIAKKSDDDFIDNQDEVEDGSIIDDSPNPLQNIISLIEKQKYREALIELKDYPYPNDFVQNTMGYCYLKVGSNEKALEYFRKNVQNESVGWKKNAPLLYKRNFIVTLLLLNREAAYKTAIQALDISEILDEGMQQIIKCYTTWKEIQKEERNKLSFFKKVFGNDKQTETPIKFDFPVGELDI